MGLGPNLLSNAEAEARPDIERGNRTRVPQGLTNFWLSATV